jgi:NADH dehydrogenase [ubiquinone] 1 alpha subcomplex assembly factor 7
MNPLEQEIQRLILHNGPIGIDRYMSLCLTHPVHGYYVTRDPLGARGDFITAPEISQMFGEMIGLWAADTWQKMGAPLIVHLVELGPGRGTLMSDLLRVARKLPAFYDALHIHLLDASPVLRTLQKKALEAFEKPLHWHDDLTSLPDGPVIIIANEFFDALPVRHFVKSHQGWHERQIGLDDNCHLCFGLAPDCDPSLKIEAPLNSIWEVSPARSQMMQEVADQIMTKGGAALIIDYGYTKPSLGETLQAMRAHGFSNPLLDPGLADLTAHVDFPTLQRVATEWGAKVHGPINQGEFLSVLGIHARAEQLKIKANPEQAMQVDQALSRLTKAAPACMGDLFKALCIAHPGLSYPSGF